MAPTRVIQEVVRASIGKQVTYAVQVEQPFVPVASNMLSGVVTWARASGRVRAGSTLFAVDGMAVRVVEGATPFYRDLRPGLRGPDVRQLQQFLVESGRLERASGTYDAATFSAVSGWQRDHRLTVTGGFTLGTLVAVPHLPTGVRIDDAIRTGTVVVGGESAVAAAVGKPQFRILLTPEQATQIPVGALVRVTHGSGTWRAVVGRSETADDGTVALRLEAATGGVVCARECGQLPSDAALSLLSTVEVVPRLTGAAVPVAAVRTDSAGNAYVLDEDGEQLLVTVLGSGDGIAIVDGLEPGDRIVVVENVQS